jgi:hypothetical protein
VTDRKTKQDWAELIREIADELYPNAGKITLVMDNLATHKPGALYDAFPPKEAKRIWDRFDFVFTPKHGSCLNMPEIDLNVLTKQCLNRRIDSIETIKQETQAWQSSRNGKKAVINWFNNKDALIRLKRFYPTILD